MYGSLGASSCIYYNIYSASAVTAQGRSLIATAGLLFEMFLSNNVSFRSLNEVVTFIHNVINEKKERKYNDNMFLDHNIDLIECFSKVMHTCGQGYMPTEHDMEIVWNIMSRLDQEDINRLYYKNNLFEFVENNSITKGVIYILQKLNLPFLNPNEVPKDIEVEMEELWSILREYVYYKYQIIDRIARMDTLPRKTCMLFDTDSQILNLDGWYRFILEKVYDTPMKIKTQLTNPFIISKFDEFGDIPNPIQVMEILDDRYDYDFYTDEVIAIQRTTNPMVMLPQDGLRYSIINILSYGLGNLINDYLVEYTKNSNAYEGSCIMNMKNEYLFKIALLSNGQKNYATIQELQEGNMVPKEFAMDIKGLAIDKSTLNKNTRTRLKNILYEDILTAEYIDQTKILKDIIIFEKQIYQSLVSGNKEYYKPVTIKSMNSYDDPMRISGIKASIVWNELILHGYEPIDLEKRNSVDILKVNINLKNIDSLKETNNDIYTRIIKLLQNERFKGEITAIAVPLDQQVPAWIVDFINYTELINNNISNFPLAALGLEMQKGSINYTNILKI